MADPIWDGKNPLRPLMGQAGWGLRWDAVRSQLSYLRGS